MSRNAARRIRSCWSALAALLATKFESKRKDDTRFFALYTVKQGNPEVDLNDCPGVSVVRIGQIGRRRLGTIADIEATVQAKVVDAVPKSGEPHRARFFEIFADDGKQAYFIAIAPH